jgi:hypothetical protein
VVLTGRGHSIWEATVIARLGFDSELCPRSNQKPSFCRETVSDFVNLQGCHMGVVILQHSRGRRCNHEVASLRRQNWTELEKEVAMD